MLASDVRWWAAAAAITLALSPRCAVAQHVPLIEYDAAAGCPTREDVQRSLETILADAAEGVPLPPIDASVRIMPTQGAFEAEVVLREGDHITTRVLRDPSCAVIADGAVVVVAIALVPGLELGAPPREGPVETEHGEPIAEPEPVTAPSTSDAPRGALRISAHGSIGALPGVVIGAEIAGALRIDALRLEIAFRGVPLVGARIAVDPSLGGELGIVAGLARAMGMIVVEPRFELLGGGGIEAGAALGRGVGISAPRDAAAPWVAVEAAVGVAWVPWPVVAFVLEVEALVPVVRPVFTVGGLGVVHRPEAVVGCVRLGVEARFP